MKKSTSKLMAIAMLSSLVLLGACGKQESAKDSFSNSKSKTVQTSKSSSSSKVKAKKRLSLVLLKYHQVLVKQLRQKLQFLHQQFKLNKVKLRQPHKQAKTK